MSEECIHGFERGFCAACFPPPPTAPVKQTRVARLKPVSLREPAPVVATASKPAEKPVVVNIADQRIYHVAHIDDLAEISRSGSLDVESGIDDEAGEPTRSERAEYVVLVSTVKQAMAITDTEGPLTRFATSVDDVQRRLATLRGDEDAEAPVDAELLVHGAFPLESVTLIGVANDRVRDAVRAALKAAAHQPKVAVYPPWFQPLSSEMA